MTEIDPLVVCALVESAYTRDNRATIEDIAGTIMRTVISNPEHRMSVVHPRGHPAATTVTPAHAKQLVEKTIRALVIHRRRGRGYSGLPAGAPMDDGDDPPGIKIRRQVPAVAHTDEVDGILSPFNVKVVVEKITEHTARGQTTYLVEMAAYTPYGQIQWPRGCTCAVLAHDETNSKCGAGHHTVEGWPRGACVYGRIGRRPVPALLQADNKVFRDNVPVWVTHTKCRLDTPGRAKIFARVGLGDLKTETVAPLLQQYREHTRRPSTYKAVLGQGKIKKSRRISAADEYPHLPPSSVVSRVHIQLPGTHPHRRWPLYCLCETVVHRDSSTCPASNPDKLAAVAIAYQELYPRVGAQMQIVMIGPPTYSLFGLEDSRDDYDPFRPARTCTILRVRDGCKPDTVIVDIVLQ